MDAPRSLERKLTMARLATLRVAVAIGLAALMVASLATVVPAAYRSPWAVAMNAESVPGTSPELNTPFLDGCAFASPDGRSLYLASNRPGGLGGIDIWVARRAHRGDPWRPPQNLGAPINSAADDFCPSPTSGRRLFFVSSRPGGCGDSDIYLTRRTTLGWTQPQNLGCKVNSAAAEAGPVYLEEGHTRLLYFSSVRPGGIAPEQGSAADADLYVSAASKHGRFSDSVLVAGVNTAANDARPHLRAEGLELVFDSDRPGTLGGPDIWSSTRRNLQARWSLPVNLGPNVNSAAAETRASFADHGRTLYFGSTRPGSEGSSDLYVTTRQRKHDVDAAATPVCRRGWPAFGAGSGCDAAATDRPVAHARLDPNRTLAKEHYAYPAPTGQKSTNTQPTEPSGASLLLAALRLVGLTMLLAVAFLWLRGRTRTREAT
jgi:WD40-like Beta Propeller Repeat